MLKKILLLIFMFIAVNLFSGCAGIKEWVHNTFEPKSKVDEVHEYHRPLEAQRLIPRPGFEGRLTNRVCTKFYGDKCEKESIKEYDMTDLRVRTKLIQLQFACHIGDKRFRICPSEAGFCRREKEPECKRWGKTIFKRKKVCREWGEKQINKFIPITDYQFLLDARTECKKGL